MKLRASHTIYSDCMRVVRNSVSYTIYSDCPRVVRNSVFLIPYIPFACVLHETPCFSYYIFRLMRVAWNSVFVISYCALHFIPAVRASYDIQYFLYRIFRLPACCMKLRASHTIYSDCMRVVRNSVFLILYIPTACASYEIQCLIPYIPTVCALHETQLKRSENRFFTYVHHARSFFRLSKHSYNRFPFNSPGSWFRKWQRHNPSCKI